MTNSPPEAPAKDTASGGRTNIEYMGLVFPIDRQLMSEKILSALTKGYYEADEAAQLPHLLQPGERVLELGSGLGLISALCAASPLVTRVTTVEANPLLIEQIRALHSANNLQDKIEVKNAVAMPTPSHKSIQFYRRQDLWASSLDPEPWGYEEEIAVPTIDLNALIADFQPTLLVVDIEGGERHLFEDAELGGIQKIMLELHQEVVGRQGMKSVFDALSRHGFHYDQWHSSRNVVTFSHLERDKASGRDSPKTASSTATQHPQSAKILRLQTRVRVLRDKLRAQKARNKQLMRFSLLRFVPASLRRLALQRSQGSHS